MGSNHQSVISFGPMFCLRPSPSCKVGVRDYDDCISFCSKKSSQVMEFKEPASPRVGCMGQIKRDKVGLSGSKTNKFIKLKKIFSGKNLTPNMSATFPDTCALVSIAEMDPPLPVPERVVKDCAAVSLWKRRGGQTLESLQLQNRSLPHTTIWGVKNSCNFFNLKSTFYLELCYSPFQCHQKKISNFSFDLQYILCWVANPRNAPLSKTKTPSPSPLAER